MTPNDLEHPVDLISAWLDGELDAPRTQLAESHLRSCAACRALVEDFKILRTAVAAEPAPAVPAELADRIAWRLRERSARLRGPGAGRLLGSIPRVLMAAGAVAAATVLGLVLLKEDVSQLGGPGSAGGFPPPPSVQESASGHPLKAAGETPEAGPLQDTASVAHDSSAPGANTGEGRISAIDVPETKAFGQARDQLGSTPGLFEDRRSDRPGKPASATASRGETRRPISATSSTSASRTPAPQPTIAGGIDSAQAGFPTEPEFAPVPPAPGGAPGAPRSADDAKVNVPPSVGAGEPRVRRAEIGQEAVESEGLVESQDAPSHEGRAQAKPQGEGQHFLPSCASLPIPAGSKGTWTVPASPLAWPAAARLGARAAAAELVKRLAGTACEMSTGSAGSAGTAGPAGETTIRIDVPREAWPRLGSSLREMGGPSLDETMAPPAGTAIIRILLRTPTPAPRR